MILCSYYYSPGAHLTYQFSLFTASLNEMEEGVAPTDCRWRPDQRAMESGDFDEANRIKVYKILLVEGKGNYGLMMRLIHIFVVLSTCTV